MKSTTLAYDQSRALALAGGMILLCLCAFAVVLLAGKAALLKLAFPAAAFAIGGWLYISRPELYLGFTWWIWFITPLVRRIIDYQVGMYDPASPVMLAPLLVTGISIFTVQRFGGRLLQRQYFPFLLSMCGVVYGYLVGIVRVGVVSATLGMLDWLLPLLLGFHVLLMWRLYPAHRQVLRTTFAWGVLVMGIYGVVQFFAAPPWDTYWMTGSGMSSIGKPEPFQIRVFSTLNAPGPFAMVMMAGLMLLFDGRGLIPRLAAVPGYVSFLLALVRGAWGGWMLALAFVAARLRGRLRARLVVILVVGAVLSIPLLMQSSISTRVSDRVSTLGDITSDGSFNARVGLYQGRTDQAILNPVGEGLGSVGSNAKFSTGEVVSYDSGVLAIPYTLGWPGTILYLGGLLWMAKGVLRTRVTQTDQFAVIVAAVACAYVVLLVLANQLVGLKGVVAWPFMGLALAAQAYHEHEDASPPDYPSGNSIALEHRSIPYHPAGART